MIRKSHFVSAAVCAAVIGSGTFAFAQSTTPEAMRQPETKSSTGATMVPQTVPATGSTTGTTGSTGSAATGSGMNNNSGAQSGTASGGAMQSSGDTAMAVPRADRN